MSELEKRVLDREAEFIESIKKLLIEQCSDRIKIAKLYQEYISCVAGINTMISTN